MYYLTVTLNDKYLANELAEMLRTAGMKASIETYQASKQYYVSYVAENEMQGKLANILVEFFMQHDMEKVN